MNTPDPSEETLRKCLELEWQDHIQTRRQTWKTLQIEAALAIGLVGLDWHLGSLPATTLFGIVLLLAAQCGIQISLHHRRVEVRKFSHILSLEERLGLHQPSLLTDVSVPQPICWTDVLHPLRSNTVLFIIRMQLAIQLFVIIYVGAQWL